MPFSSAVEACRLPDDLLAQAYEGTSAERRSWIKTTLALVESVHQMLPASLSIRVENPAAGFGFTRTRKTAPWAVLLIGEGYASAIRLAAAVMPARLAGVEPIIAVCTGTEAVPPALLAALELTGVEQVFAMRDPSPLLGELTGRGRLLCFGKAPLPTTTCPVWNDHPPRIECGGLTEAVQWAHPDALPADDSAEVAYAKQSFSEDPRLTLGSGLDGCWLHTDLSPEFFMNEWLELAAVTQEDERPDPDRLPR